MRWLFQIGLILLVAAPAAAEVIDRIAVTVDKMVITTSDIDNHLRIAALLNNRPPEFGVEERRSAARQLVEQVLVRREMEISRYPAPDISEVTPLLEQIRSSRAPDDEAYRELLAKYGVEAEDLTESLLLQLTVLRFVEYRFRPGIAITDEAIESYYRETFLPRWTAGGGAGAAPVLDEVRDDIEEILIQRDVDKALDRWLAQAALRATIQYHKEAFE